MTRIKKSSWGTCILLGCMVGMTCTACTRAYLNQSELVTQRPEFTIVVPPRLVYIVASREEEKEDVVRFTRSNSLNSAAMLRRANLEHDTVQQTVTPRKGELR
jgi:hypothetical protein